MIPTFYSASTGDIIYYVTLEKSKFTHKTEIKSAVITDLNQTGNDYELEVTLNNGMKFKTNWNCDYHNEPIVNDEEKQYRGSIAKPFFCTIYCLDKKALKEIVQELIEKSIEYIARIQIGLQDEMVRLSGLRLLAGSLETKKVEELVLETVII